MHVLFERTDSAWILIALKTNPEFGEAMRKINFTDYSLYLIKANKT